MRRSEKYPLSIRFCGAWFAERRQSEREASLFRRPHPSHYANNNLHFATAAERTGGSGKGPAVSVRKEPVMFCRRSGTGSIRRGVRGFFYLRPSEQIASDRRDPRTAKAVPPATGDAGERVFRLHSVGAGKSANPAAARQRPASGGSVSVLSVGIM